MRLEDTYSILNKPLFISDTTLKIISASPALLKLLSAPTVQSLQGRAVSEFLEGADAPLSGPKILLLRGLTSAAPTPVVVECLTQGDRVVWAVSPPRGVPRLEPRGPRTLDAALQRKLSVDDVHFGGRRVLIRVDFNVPMDPKTHHVIDPTRIRATIPTLRKMLAEGASVVVMSHFGRPKGVDDKLSLRHVVPCFEAELGRTVAFAPNALDADAAVRALKQGEVLLLENVRFHSAEDSKNKEERLKMAKVLASYADVFVSDAFGTAHRDSASMTGVPEVMGFGIAGKLICAEVEALRSVVIAPPSPLVAIVGGAKVSDKIALLGSLFKRASTVLIGGAMAFTFLEAQGHSSGGSKTERVSTSKGGQVDLIEVARKLLKVAADAGVRVLTPIDHRCVVLGQPFATAEIIDVSSPSIPKNLAALDIGPRTQEAYRAAISGARSIVWNGPMGLFEQPRFAVGSHFIARTIASNVTAVSVVGGGETAACAAPFKTGISHISTGGGATLELLEGKALPGLTCLTSVTFAKL